MNACQTRLGIRKIEEGGGVDLKVAKDGDVPDVARSLCVGDFCEYYWNEEYEWCRAKVVDKVGPLNGEIIFTLKFDSDGEEHKCGFGWADRARWRPAQS